MELGKSCILDKGHYTILDLLSHLSVGYTKADRITIIQFGAVKIDGETYSDHRITFEVKGYHQLTAGRKMIEINGRDEGRPQDNEEGRALDHKLPRKEEGVPYQGNRVHNAGKRDED